MNAVIAVKCDTSTKLTKSLWQAYMHGVYGRKVSKRFEKNNSDTTKKGMYEADFSFFEVSAGGEAMGGLHRGARTHSRAH